MKKTILIAPSDCPIGMRLTAEAALAGFAPFGAARGLRPGTERDAVPPEERHASWEPSSYVSARALVMEALNARSSIDAAIVIVPFEAVNEPFHSLAPGALGAALESRVMGPAWMAREMADLFASAGAGILGLVVEEPPEGTVDAIAAMAYGAARGLFDSILAARPAPSGQAPAWAAYGFSDRGGRPEIAAQAVMRTIAEAPPRQAWRWSRVGGQGGLFSRG